ncbi:MAG: hypothetical protein QM760_03850 [Nibricoccus sp.]
MIHLFFSRLRPLLVPVIVLAACVAAIFLLRNTGGQPRGQLLMQAEMNRQFDTFQVALAQANDTQIEMQRRMLRAEEIRVALTTQFERSQKELVQTQRALHNESGIAGDAGRPSADPGRLRTDSPLNVPAARQVHRRRLSLLYLSPRRSRRHSDRSWKNCDKTICGSRRPSRRVKSISVDCGRTTRKLEVRWRPLARSLRCRRLWE